MLFIDSVEKFVNISISSFYGPVFKKLFNFSFFLMINKKYFP